MVYMNKKFSISLLSLCIGLSSAISFSADARDITIYYTNDLHAHVTPEIIPYVSKTRPVGGFALMNPLMILVKIIKLRWIHILSYDQMV
ncbi:bifunctional metallophosphatase/5'-nucleotidase, partial [Salmonella enterica]